MLKPNKTNQDKYGKLLESVLKTKRRTYYNTEMKRDVGAMKVYIYSLNYTLKLSNLSTNCRLKSQKNDTNKVTILTIFQNFDVT